MKSKREETPGCRTYGFGQTEGQILASRVSNHTPLGTALHLLVNLLSLLCAGREGVVASPTLSPTAGASTDPVPPLPAGTKVWACPYGSAFIDRSGTRRFPMWYVSHCEESVNGLSLCSRVRRESQPIWIPSLAHACQLSRDGSLPQVFQSSLIISTLSNNNKLWKSDSTWTDMMHLWFWFDKTKIQIAAALLPTSASLSPSRHRLASPGLFNSMEAKLAFRPCLFSQAAVKAPGKFWRKHKK